MVRTLSPLTVSSNGPPAFKGPINSCQRPCASAVVCEDLLSRVTVTRSLGFALPQMRTFTLSCKTMLSPMTAGRRTSPCALLTTTRRKNSEISLRNLCCMTGQKLVDFPLTGLDVQAKTVAESQVEGGLSEVVVEHESTYLNSLATTRGRLNQQGAHH